MLLSDIKPPYPLEARKRGEEGVVVIRASIDAAGRTQTLKVIGSSGYASLDEAAEAAARKARFRFTGAQRLGPSVETTLTFRFNLLD